MKKLLIIGASILQLPAIVHAKKMGYMVGVVDYNPNAIGIQYADLYFNVSTNDIEGVVCAAKQFKPDGIITLATDMPVRSVAKAASLLGLPGISPGTALKATNKAEMIKAFKEHGVESPWFYIVESEKELNIISEQLVYPCIMKPADNSGSRGVVLVNDLKTLKDSYMYSKVESRSGAVIIEEFMTGQEVSVELITINGESHILAVTDKLTTGAPHFVEMGHSQPSQLNSEKIDMVKELASKAVKAVGVENGACHVEIMVTEDGPKMIEIGARLGGDCIASHLVYLSTGIDMIDAVIKLACSERADLSPKLKKGSAIRYITSLPGTIHEISGLDEAMTIDGVKEAVATKKQGDTISEIQQSNDRIGYVIAQADTANEAVKICENALQKIHVFMY